MTLIYQIDTTRGYSSVSIVICLQLHPATARCTSKGCDDRPHARCQIFQTHETPA